MGYGYSFTTLAQPAGVTLEEARLAVMKRRGFFLEGRDGRG